MSDRFVVWDEMRSLSKSFTPRYPLCMAKPWFRRKESTMKKYVCPCGYVYDEALGDPDSGIAPGTKFEDIPEDWVCPVCGLTKDVFEVEE